MSSRITVCPACHVLAQHVELSEEQSAALAGLILKGGENPNRWRIDAKQCGHCGRPWVALWPFDSDLMRVTELAGLLASSVEQHAKGGHP